MNTRISKKMKYFGIYCLTVLPLVICSVPTLDNVLKITNCPDCKKFPSKSSNYSDFSVIVKKNNTPTFLVGARDGVLQMTMDGQLIHYTSIPSKKADRETCLRNMQLGIVDEKSCGNIISGIFPHKRTGLILACGSNSGQSQLCWNANETSIVGGSDTYAFYTIPERKYVISDPYIFQGYTFPDNQLNGELLRVDIYSTVGSKLKLRLNDDAPRFVGVYEFGNYIYYFFSDISEEKIKDGSRVTYARVGRLCKHDTGGTKSAPGSTYFHTFSKARLLCPTTTGGEVFQFNNLELTSVITGDDGEVYIYGLFRAAKPADNLFAICRYSLSEIEKAFASKKYYERDDKSIKIVDAGDDDLRHKTCNESLETQTTTYDWYLTYKKRLLHVSVVSPDTGKPVIIRNHATITSMLAENVIIASKSYDIVRLFDSNFMYELFVPANFFQEQNVETFLSTRKICEESLTIKDVSEIKFTGIETPVASSSGLPKATTTVVSKLDVSTTPKPSSTRRPPTASSLSTPTIPNLTADNQTMLGNVSTTSPKPSFGHVPTAVSSSTKGVSGMPTATLNPAAKPSPSKTTTPMSSSASSPTSWDSFIGQEKIIVAAMERLLFVPVASCGAHATCRDCVAAMNPYCAWQNGNCVQLNATGNGVYIQDKENGDYSKVCPPVDVTCDVQVSKMVPNADVTLRCYSSGLPDPRESHWSKDDRLLITNSNVTINGGELKIRSFTLGTVGRYTCHVSNNVTSYSCSVEIRGSKPKIDCKVTMLALSCNASGYPQPEMVLETKSLQAEKNQQTGLTKVVIVKGLEYEFIAYNAFGPKSGGVYEFISKSLEFKIKGERWRDELVSTGSQEYITLKNKVMKAINALYKDNSFYRYAKISFRKGSVIATVEISGLKTPTSDESVLTGPLEEAIQTKKLGDLTISDPDETPDVPDQKSTPAPSRTPSTREVSSPPPGKQTSLPTSFPSTRLPASTRLPSTRKPILSSRPVVATLGTKSVAQDSSSSGVPLWLLFLLLILIGLIVFFAGYFCGVRGFNCRTLYDRTRLCTKDSSGSVEDSEEMKAMSRSEKTRESERMLLRTDGGEKQSPSKKNSPSKKRNNELGNNVSKHGSVEIKRSYNSDEDCRPASEHSMC